MKVFLLSSLGGSVRINGVRTPSKLLTANGLTDNLKSVWKKDAKVLIISANPEDHERNDSIRACLKEAFPMSGLRVSLVETLDSRTLSSARRIEDYDTIILAGGHVPTQNRFLNSLCIKEKLRFFSGTVIAWSAGAMNCADTVYAAPELEGEAADPAYERWLPGLAFADINILPHFQKLTDVYLDGKHLIHDIVLEDSKTHEIIALNDGSYIYLSDGHAVLYGEAYSLRSGSIQKICSDEGCLSLY